MFAHKTIRAGWRLVGLLIVLGSGWVYPVPASQALEAPIVRAVLFYSPTCHFCRQIVDEDLPPVIQEYGIQLQILYVDVNTSAGETLYQSALDTFQVNGGVPLLFVGSVVVGGVNIPKQLPELVENYLAQGGRDWPKIPGLEAYLSPAPSATSTAAILLPTGTATPFTPMATRPSMPLDLGRAQPVVRAIMFWKEGCPHCHDVLDTVLPPLQQKYGAQLEIVLVELKSAEDLERFYQTAAAFGIAQQDAGVPFLIIGNRVLQGSTQIPLELPGLIEQYLAQRGVDFPNLSALAGVLPTAAANEGMCMPSAPCVAGTATPMAAFQPTASEPPVAARARPLGSNGFALAIGVMLGMTAALAYTGLASVRSTCALLKHSQPGRNLGTLVLALAGLGVAGYLAYVETQAAPAVCGPVGDCNAVQSSSYARLFGVLPIGVLGVLGYLGILATWMWSRLRSDRLAKLAPLALFGMVLFGTLFSLYLTYLELFVIKAVCAWCLTSAIIMPLLMLLNLPPALQTIHAWRHKN